MFRIRLFQPSSRSGIRPVARLALVEEVSLNKQRRILVADDDAAVRETLRRILVGAGYEVVFAEDGKSVVEKASTYEPDLVLVDGLMPKLHGFLACKAIKELDAPPKVILF